MNSVRLWFGLVHMRYGALHWVGAGMLVAAALLHGVLVPRIAGQAEAVRQVIAAQSASAQIGAPGVAVADDDRPAALARRYDALATVVADEGQIARIVRDLFAHAARSGVVLAQSDYKRSSEPGGGLTTLEIRLPVKGRYPKIRRFISDTLVSMPGVALRDVSFRRDGINVEGVEAQLRFIVFLKDPVR